MGTGPKLGVSRGIGYMTPVDIHPIGSYDVKGLGRIYLIRTSDLPEGVSIRLGSLIKLKENVMVVRGINYPGGAIHSAGLILEDYDEKDSGSKG